MPNFKTQGKIILQPNDSMNYYFSITSASTASGNDGFLPYGRTVSSVAVFIYNSLNTIVTTDIVVGTPTVSNNVVNVVMKYPILGGIGRYKMTIICTLDNGDKKEADFSRIYAENN